MGLAHQEGAHRVADPFDSLESNYQQSFNVASDPFDSLESNFQADIASRSDLGAIRNAAVKGGANALGLMQQVVPTIDIRGGSVFAPKMFGLAEYLGFEDAPDITQTTKDVGRNYGIFDDTKAKTELGQLAADVVEQGISAAPFGPIAMAGSAATSGPGAYGGRKIGSYFGNEELGAGIGSIISPFAVAGAKTVLQKGAQSLGPTAAQALPSKIRDPIINRAVGNTLRDAIDNPDQVQNILESAPPSAFRTAAEVADSRGLASLEDVVRAKGADALASLPEARQAARANDIIGALDDVPMAVRSDALEGTLRASVDEVEKVEKELWNLLPKQAKLIGNHLDDSLKASINEITLDGSIPLTGAAGGLIKRWDNISEDVLSVDQLQAFRSKVLQEGREARKLLNRNPTQEARVTAQVADALKDHIDNVMDTNVSAGLVDQEVADIWKGARDYTRQKMDAFVPRTGPASKATKAALNNIEMADAKAITEGLRSPDLMRAQIRAAELGGQDIRPIYQEALKAELSNKMQSKWPDFIANKRQQFEIAFDGDLTKIDDALADIASEQLKNDRARAAFGANSSTFTRQDLNARINARKGIAALGASAAPSLSGAAGAAAGWQYGESYPEKIALGVLGGISGAAAGKGYRSLTSRASEMFDDNLATALRNPQIAAQRLKDSRPSAFREVFEQALKEAMPQAGARGSKLAADRVLGTSNTIVPSSVSQQEQEPEQEIESSQSNETLYRPSAFNLLEDDMAKSREEIEQEIDADPFFALAYQLESGRGKYLKNPKSSASGPFQMINSTAKAVGVNAKDDDFTDDLEGMKKLKAEYLEQGIPDDPIMLYAAHYLGVPTLKKWLSGDDLTEKQQQHVNDFENVLVPRAKKFLDKYGQVKA